METVLENIRFNGEKLKEARGKLSLRDAAKKLGISAQSLSDMELSKIKPAADTLARLCAFYNLELSDLFENMPDNFLPDL